MHIYYYDAVCVVVSVLLISGFITLIPTDLIFGEVSRVARCVPAGLLMM